MANTAQCVHTTLFKSIHSSTDILLSKGEILAFVVIRLELEVYHVKQAEKDKGHKFLFICES